MTGSAAASGSGTGGINTRAAEAGAYAFLYGKWQFAASHRSCVQIRGLYATHARSRWHCQAEAGLVASGCRELVPDDDKQYLMRISGRGVPVGAAAHAPRAAASAAGRRRRDAAAPAAPAGGSGHAVPAGENQSGGAEGGLPVNKSRSLPYRSARCLSSSSLGTECSFFSICDGGRYNIFIHMQRLMSSMFRKAFLPASCGGQNCLTLPHCQSTHNCMPIFWRSHSSNTQGPECDSSTVPHPCTSVSMLEEQELSRACW